FPDADEAGPHVGEQDEQRRTRRVGNAKNLRRADELSGIPERHGGRQRPHIPAQHEQKYREGRQQHLLARFWYRARYGLLSGTERGRGRGGQGAGTSTEAVESASEDRPANTSRSCAGFRSRCSKPRLATEMPEVSSDTTMTTASVSSER